MAFDRPPNGDNTGTSAPPMNAEDYPTSAPPQNTDNEGVSPQEAYGNAADTARTESSAVSIRFVDELSSGFKEWCAAVGVISALLASMTLGPITQRDLSEPTVATQVFTVFFGVSFACGVGSVLALVQLLAIFVHCPVEDRAWWFKTYFRDAELPNVLMIASAITMLIGLCIRVGENMGVSSPAFIIILVVMVLFATVGGIWAVLVECKFTKTSAFDKIAGTQFSSLFQGNTQEVHDNA